MMQSRCPLSRQKVVLGIDLGTESGRVIAARVDDGRELALSITPYPNGVINDKLPNGPKLEPNWALQDPRDWLLVLEESIPKVVKEASLASEDIIGIGIDCTASTPLPTKADGTPLCFLSDFRKRPHAWPKLWKHHSAEEEANQITQIGHDLNEIFIGMVGKYSAESFLSKVLQVLNEDPTIYKAADRFIEAADWMVWQLSGQERRAVGTESAALAGKYAPSTKFLRQLHPSLPHIHAKLVSEYYPLGKAAGGLSPLWARKTGLRRGTPVAVGNVDSHVAVPGSGVTNPATLVMIMGTSLVHWLLAKEYRVVQGMRQPMKDGVIAGLWGYEAGQPAVGDLFGWFFDRCVPPSFHDEAQKKRVSFQSILEQRAEALRPGQSGLIALDWWNGNRSILTNTELTGIIIGLNLATRSEHIYRALIEATAFGTRQIIEAFESRGLLVENIVACGGLPQRNRLLMQIYADVSGREIRLAEKLQSCSAFGSAMHGAVAARRSGGGYDSVFEAAKHMVGSQGSVFRPRREHSETYNHIFAQYQILHDYFGRGKNDVMSYLKTASSGPSQSATALPVNKRKKRGRRRSQHRG